MDLNCCFCEPLTRKYCISFILWLLACPAEILGSSFLNIYIYSEDWYEHAHCEPAYWGLDPCWLQEQSLRKSASGQWSRSFTAITDCWTVTATSCYIHLPSIHCYQVMRPPLPTLSPLPHHPSPPLCPLNPVLQLALSALTIESLLPQGGVLWGVFSEGLQRWPWHCNSHTHAHT